MGEGYERHQDLNRSLWECTYSWILLVNIHFLLKTSCESQEVPARAAKRPFI